MGRIERQDRAAEPHDLTKWAAMMTDPYASCRQLAALSFYPGPAAPQTTTWRGTGNMPFRTPHGRKYHANQGCHGATIPCSMEGLSPCWYCDAGLREARRAQRERKKATAAGTASSANTTASGNGAAGGSTSFAKTASPLAETFAAVASNHTVTAADLPEHYHEERFSVPGAITGRGMEMLGIGELSELTGLAGSLGEYGDDVDRLVGQGDVLGALGLALAIDGAGDEESVTSEGGWTVCRSDETSAVLERLQDAGIDHPNAFALPGNLRLVCSRSGDSIDISRGRDEMTAADIALAMSCTRRSANGPYQLLHYNQLACYVNGYMGGTNAMWSAYDGFLTELRGTVYDTRDMSVVSNPYYKFRNLNECEDYSEANLRAAIDANGGRMVATEKLDGSLIQMRYVEQEDRDGGAWKDGMLVTTSNTIEGSAASADNSHLVNVERLYVQNPEDDRYRSLAKANPDKTLCFEFVRPDVDPHVVTYDESEWGMWLTGMRDVRTGRLSTHEEVAAAADEFGVPHPRVVATNLDECLRVVETGDGRRMEGMVVDVDGWLVKMKLTDFLALSHVHHSLDGSRGFKDVLRMTHEGTIDDALGGLPAPSRAMVDGIIDRASRYHERMSEAIDSVMAGAPDPKADRGAFARWVQAQPIPSGWRGYLFAKADGKEPPVYYAERHGDQLSYFGRNELAEHEAELERWLAERREERS